MDQENVPEDLGIGEWTIHGRTLARTPHVRLDLGGIAKGWAADRAVESDMAMLVSAGGDVRSCIEKSQVEIIDPWEATPATVVLGIGGLATSSVSRRRWKCGGREAHHIIDPTTAAPARSPVLSASAACRTAAEAEAAAKTVLLLGEQGLAWAERQSWIDAAMATWHDKSVFATQGWEIAA